MKEIRILIGFVCFLVLFSACKKPSDNYPNEPQLEFKSFYAYDKFNALMVLKFTDGDSDLGLKAEDTTGIFSKTSPYYYNLYIKTYYKNAQGQFVDTAIFDINTSTIDTGLIRQRIQYITNDTKEPYIRGELQIELYGYRQSTAHKTIKYKIYMYDRATHKSNELETPELSVP